MKRGRPKKQTIDEKITEKIEKVDIPTHIKGTGVEEPLGIVTAGKEETIEEDESMLPKKDLFRVDEVARYFSIVDRTVRLWIEHGHLVAKKKGGTIFVTRKSILDCHILDKRKVL